MPFAIVTEWGFRDGMKNRCVSTNIPDDQRDKVEEIITKIAEKTFGLDETVEIDGINQHGHHDPLRLRLVDIKSMRIQG